MLAQLRVGSAKAKRPPPQQPKLLVTAQTQPSGPPAAAVGDDDYDDEPKANWMQLMKQKKQAKESTIAHMIRVRHAVMVVQVRSRASCWHTLQLSVRETCAVCCFHLTSRKGHETPLNFASQQLMRQLTCGQCPQG